MVTILHISDLHFVKNAGSYNMESILLKEAESVKDRPKGEKFLIVTGDFHSFADMDYRRAYEFLKKLRVAMGIEMDEDVFVIPGNHDVGNDKTLKKALSKVDPYWERNQRNNVRDLKEGERDSDIVNQRLMAFRPYCDFVRSLGIYDKEPDDPDYPARVHVRCWRGKLNLLHLNTALAADGTAKDNQVVDVDTAADPKTWEKINTEDIPTLALGHNSFYDLAEIDDKPSMQLRTALKSAFFNNHVSAYLCGDTHRKELDGDRQFVRLGEGYHHAVSLIPNIVCAKSVADMSDNYSDFGYYWHEWDEASAWVKLKFQRWNPKYINTTRLDGLPNEGYVMKRIVSSTVEPMPSAAPAVATVLGTPDKDGELRSYLFRLFRRTRNVHPSFRLIALDEIDRRLFPGIKEAITLLPSRGSVEQDGPVSPIWDIVRESWKTRPVRNVVIEGEGGIGKTTALFSLSNVEDPADVPAVYVPMHQLLRKDGTLIDISDYLKGLSETYGMEICRLASDPMGDRPNLLVLLDGFNEVRADKRWEMLRAVNEWFTNHPGAQIVAVSRHMDGLNLGAELAGNPISVTLEPLTPEAVRANLQNYGRGIPPVNAPIWKDLRYPLFLTLYLKTGELPKNWAGYPLAPKKADSGGALIWNFLQRELMRRENEDWVLRCAVACEYLLPRIAWEMTERHSFVLEQDEAIQWTEQALAELNPDELPRHLCTLFQTYRRRYSLERGAMPDFSGVNWNQTVLQDCGLLVPYQGEREAADDTPRFALMHQNFRDCLAALHLVNSAEAANRELPQLWRRSHNPYLMDYAAELADADTAARLWEAMRTLRPTDSAAVYTQLELQKRRGDGRALDFSGMDLRDISFAPYIRRGEGSLSLFRSATLSAGTELASKTFRFQGHSGSVNCVAALLDECCVSGSNDNTLRVWDFDSGVCLSTLEGHSGSVNCVAALPDGLCVSGSDDRTLRVWDIDTGECLRVLEGHSRSVTCVTALSEGCCVSGSDDGTLRVWDIASGVSFRTLEGHRGLVSCVTALPDGRIVSGSADGTIRVWDSDSRVCLRVLEGDSTPVTSVSTLPDGRCVSGTKDGKLRVWDSNTGECLRTMEGHSDSVYCVAVLPDGRCVSGSADGTLRVWDSATGECQRTLAGHSGSVTCVAALPDGRCVSGSNDWTLRVWDSATGECLHTLAGHSDWVRCVAALPDGRCVSGSDDGTLRVWDSATGECLRTLAGHSGSVTCAAALPDGRCISGSNDGTLRVWDSATGECLRTLAGHSAWVTCVAALPDGRCVSGSVDRTLRVWDIDTGVCQFTLEGHSDWVRCIAALADGRIISGSDDGTIRVWDNKVGLYLGALDERRLPVTSVAALPNCHCVSGSVDGTLRVWDIEVKGIPRSLKGHSKWVNCVAALPDGRIFSGSDDGTLRVWDIKREASLRTLDGHSGPVTGVAVLPDGRCISSSMDGTLRIWDPNTGKCLDILEPMEVDVRGMDFSQAILTPDLAKQLWQNGAKNSDADYRNYVQCKP